MGDRTARVLNSGSVGSFYGSGAEDSRTLRFGVFELDLRAGELRRNGIKVKLQEQPFQILAQLLETPGEVVTREQLRDRLWPADTFVDFDHSLNAAIRRLRDALRDSAENPTFVETVARRGYRFLAPVTVKPSNGTGPQVAPFAAEPHPHPAKRLRIWWLVAGSAAVVLVLLGLKLGLLLAHNHVSAPYRISQLTANPADDRVRVAAISRDGKYLAFSDETGFYLREIDSGETHPLNLPAGLKADSISWFPDGTHLEISLFGQGQPSSLWEISTLGGAARKLNDEAWSPAVSPDGKQVAFVTGKELRQQVWLMDTDGGQPRKLVGEPGDFFAGIAWSPDGTMLAYTRGRLSYAYSVNGTIEILDVKNRRIDSAPVRLSSWMFSGLNGPLAWAPDGRLIYSLSEPPPRPPDSNLWSMTVNQQGQQVGSPVRLTDSPGAIYDVTSSSDGKSIAYIKGVPQPDVYVADLTGRDTISEPQRLTLDDHQDVPFDWTPDGKQVIFISDRTGRFSIYKQAVDQTTPEMLIRSNESLFQARLSPDGTQLIYLIFPDSASPKHVTRLMSVPLAGGTPRDIVEDSWISNHQCARAPATVCIFSVIGNRALTFFAFDPINGKGPQVYRLEDDFPQLYNWTLSPDGATLAIAKGKWTDDEGSRIHLVALNGGAERWLNIPGLPGIASIDWAADSRSLWAVTSGQEENELLNIDLPSHDLPGHDLQGRARVVWKPVKKHVGWAIPSRDGRRLALHVSSSSANAFMLERP